MRRMLGSGPFLAITLILLGAPSRKETSEKNINEHYFDLWPSLEFNFLFPLGITGHLGCISGTTKAEELKLGLGPENNQGEITDQVINPAHGSWVSHFIRHVRDQNMPREELEREKVDRSE